VESVENTLEIYNRWNQAVTTRITNYTNNWDGKRAGVALPEGVYYYVLTFKDDMGVSRILKGYFNIIH
jgi:gliding motility-associated-like protein